MHLLITGGSGFIGRHVAAEALGRGHRVRAVTRSASTDAAATADVVRHDLRDPAGIERLLDGVDAVIHCAAAMGGDFATQRADTVDGTRNLLEGMERAGVRDIVLLSTFALYDYRAIQPGGLLDESSPLDDALDERAPYIRAKREQEQLVRSPAGGARRWTVLRPGIVFGTGRTWFHHLGVQLTPTRWLCFAPDSPLPLTYVESCAGAVVLAAENESARGETFNVVDDAPPSRARYVQLLADRTVPRPAVTYVPWWLLDGASRTVSSIGGAVFRGRLPVPDLLRPASLHARGKPLRYSNAKLRTALGWEPRFGLVEALDRSVAAAPPPSPLR